MKRTFTVTYGLKEKTFELDEALLACEPIAPRAAGPALSADRIRDTMGKALGSPMGRPPLREMARGRRVGLVVSDEFRAGLQREIIDLLLEEISAGGPASIKVLCATGTHDPAVYARNISAWVGESARRLGITVDFFANDCDGEGFVPLGRSPLGTEILVSRHLLETDLRVHGHESKHHYMAGYSSVDKQVVPGLTARRTVEDNHRRSLSPDSGPGRSPWQADPSRRQNPFSIDARDIRRITEGLVIDHGTPARRKVETFALDMISGKSSIFFIAAGDPDLLCGLMPTKVDEEAMFVVEPSRYVIISPGGPPASQNLYGVQNCFDMSLLGAIRSGGEALIIAPCDGRPDLREGVRGIAPDEKSKQLFWDTLVRMRDWEIEAAREAIEKHFELYLWKTFRVLRLLKVDRVGLYLHSELPASVVEEGGLRAVADIQAWIDERAARGDGSFTVIDNGNKLFVLGKPSGVV